MGEIVGIDLGTTNSLVAIHESRGPRIVPLHSWKPALRVVVLGLAAGCLLLLISGCGSLINVIGITPHTGGDGEYYGGVMIDLDEGEIAMDSGVWLLGLALYVDVPLSAVLDTALIPYYFLYQCYLRKLEADARDAYSARPSLEVGSRYCSVSSVFSNSWPVSIRRAVPDIEVTPAKNSLIALR